MEDQWRIASYQSEWRQLFFHTGTLLRKAMKETAIRIDHIGSTSIEGLAAKPIIDIQISVADYQNLACYQLKIESIGFILRSENPDLSKRYFRERPGDRRTHIHVRQVGSYSEQLSLLFRDYLRLHPEDCLRYAREKHRLMKEFYHERAQYVEGKGPIVWDILQRAHTWSQNIGWEPGPSDL
ncbi:GrpB family protein [Paenibacillus paeoniae]|uniref:GrpB family protein n=1 Tax=Paenibacillus paeoniae TaxID=2292705 RepID=A0A371PLF2_9BACL|nr:GrpB family protein [Paenibacillus paeoniae]REK77021.1 GrpB family protein [Paenibacillus paeoniae]